MPISNSINRWPYTGNGITTVFGFDGAVFATGDLKVYAGGALKLLGVDYTVSINADRTGAVTFGVAPADGIPVLLVRDVPATQTKNFPAFNSFPAEQVTEAFDKLTVLVQQLFSSVGRKIGIADTDSMANFSLPALAQRAGKLLGFDGAGEMVASSLTIAEMEQGAVVATAQAAIATAAAGTATTQAGIATAAAGAAATSADEAEAALAGVLAYAGNPVAFALDGDGVTVAFDLPVTPPNPDALALFVGGLYSRPPAWSLSNRTVTFASAPPSGTRMVAGFVGARGITLDAEAKFQHLAWEIYRLGFEKLSRSDAAATYIALAGTAAYGRGALAMADAVAARAYIGLEIGLGPTQQAPNWATLKS
ncbi:hypothetical protein [Ferrovibrio sp.]|uniref:hypothetical protein n=1 Tax=Ferrovibrio sp. TaxID=1917215 RepID=UPI003D13C5C1